jgi:hypothetical protein
MRQGAGSETAPRGGCQLQVRYGWPLGKPGMAAIKVTRASAGRRWIALRAKGIQPRWRPAPKWHPETGPLGPCRNPRRYLYRGAWSDVLPVGPVAVFQKANRPHPTGGVIHRCKVAGEPREMSANVGYLGCARPARCSSVHCGRPEQDRGRRSCQTCSGLKSAASLVPVAKEFRRRRRSLPQDPRGCPRAGSAARPPSRCP